MVLPPPSTMVDTTYECRDAALHAPVEVPVRLALDPVMRQAEHRGEVGFGGHLDGRRAEDTRNCVRPLARTVAASGRLYMAIGIRGLGLPGSRSVITPRLAWDAHSRLRGSGAWHRLAWAVQNRTLGAPAGADPVAAGSPAGPRITVQIDGGQSVR